MATAQAGGFHNVHGELLLFYQLDAAAWLDWIEHLSASSE